MNYKRKTELRLWRIESEQLKLQGRLNKMLESMLRLSNQDVKTLLLIETLANELKNKKTNRGR